MISRDWLNLQDKRLNIMLLYVIGFTCTMWSNKAHLNSWKISGIDGIPPRYPKIFWVYCYLGLIKAIPEKKSHAQPNHLPISHHKQRPTAEGTLLIPERNLDNFLGSLKGYRLCSYSTEVYKFRYRTYTFAGMFFHQPHLNYIYYLFY